MLLELHKLGMNTKLDMSIMTWKKCHKNELQKTNRSKKFINTYRKRFHCPHGHHDKPQHLPSNDKIPCEVRISGKVLGAFNKLILHF